MGLRDILREAIEDAGIPISDKDFMRYYNRCIHDLSMTYDTAKKSDTQVINCNDINAEYSLTEGCLKIERVLDSNNLYYKHFKVRKNSKILFRYLGTYTVYGLFEYQPITSMDDAIEINPVFTRAIELYIAAKAVKKDNPDLSSELMGEYYAKAADANRNIRKADNPVKKMKAPVWR